MKMIIKKKVVAWQAERTKTALKWTDPDNNLPDIVWYRLGPELKGEYLTSKGKPASITAVGGNDRIGYLL